LGRLGHFNLRLDQCFLIISQILDTFIHESVCVCVFLHVILFFLACGHFLYFEASDYGFGAAVSPPFSSTSGEMCLEFSLSMYSDEPESMGIIYASLYEGITWVNLFWNSFEMTYTGPMEWRKIRLNLPSLSTSSSYKVCELGLMYKSGVEITGRLR